MALMWMNYLKADSNKRRLNDRRLSNSFGTDVIMQKNVTDSKIRRQSNAALIVRDDLDVTDEERNSKIRRQSNAALIVRDDLVMKRRSSKSEGITPQRSESRNLEYRRQSLDLRQHIESAGHQIDHCPFIFVDRSSCRGYLQKMTSKFNIWNKRWFVFDRKKCSFTYYSDKSEKKLRGGIYFQNLLSLCTDNHNNIRSPNPNSTFILKSTERIYYLLAPSIESMRIWFDVLATEVETFQNI